MSFLLAKLKNRFIAFSYDTAAIFIAWFGAYWLRFNLASIPASMLKEAWDVLPIVIAIQIISYWMFGLYRGIWRFASIPDLVRIIKAVTTAIAAIALVLFFSTRVEGIPRSVFLFYGMLLIAILGGSRLLYRRLKHHINHFSDASRVLIIGAGQAGEGLVRDLLRDVTHQYNPVGFVDDDKKKQGLEIHGIRVLGKSQDIAAIVKSHRINLIMIALPSISSMQMRKIVNVCVEADVQFRTLPGLHDLADGRVSISALRAVLIEDLLGREPVSLDWKQVSESLQHKIILVSGGGGSIGSELCRQIAKLNPARLVILESCEFNLYSLELELSQKFPTLSLLPLLVDVTDRAAVQKVMSEYHPEIIFHAAAYKHVPLLQTQIRAAVRNNILGTRILAEEAVAQGVQKFILISTDKAVNPTNLLGATKRAAEILCQNFNGHSQTQFLTVRFGNVLDSAGSVVPLFRKQISQGGPVTVTHPEITRFFMTIPEAAQLILQAAIMGQGGEIFVLDMGEPIKISYLAEQMIKLAGLKLNEDIEIHYSGLRPGEKLFEELFHEGEQLISTGHAKILQAQYRLRDWNELISILNAMNQACEVCHEASLLSLLLRLVPEYLSEEREDRKEKIQI